MNMSFKLLSFLIFISMVFAQRIEDQVLLNDLNDAIHFAHQNNLNVLIEDFTGVG